LRISLTGAALRAAILTTATAALLAASTAVVTVAAPVTGPALAAAAAAANPQAARDTLRDSRNARTTYSVRTNARRDTLYLVPAIVIEARRDDPVPNSTIGPDLWPRWSSTVDASAWRTSPTCSRRWWG